MSGFVRGNLSGVPAEFTNLTGRTLAQLQAGVTLADPTAGEVARVRDIAITQTISRPWRLRAGATPILSGQGSVRLTGHEDAFPGAPLVLDTSVSALLNKLSILSTTTTHVDVTLGTIFSGDKPTALTGTAPTANPSPNLGVTPHFSCFGANGDFYYATISSGAYSLYRRAGGVTGTETTVTGGTFYNFCYDGSRYLYMISTSAFREIDTLTGTVGPSIAYTGVTTLQIASDFVSSAAAMDRYFAVRCDGAQSPAYSIVLVNGQTGAAVSLGASSVVSAATRFPLAFNKLSNGQYVLHVLSTTSTLRVNIGTNLASPVVQGATSLSYAGAFFNYSGGYNPCIPLSWARSMLLVLMPDTSNHSLIDLDTGEIMMNKVSSSSLFASTYTSWAVRPIDATVAEADFGTLSVRATGERIRL